MAKVKDIGKSRSPPRSFRDAFKTPLILRWLREAEMGVGNTVCNPSPSVSVPTRQVSWGSGNPTQFTSYQLYSPWDPGKPRMLHELISLRSLPRHFLTGVLLPKGMLGKSACVSVPCYPPWTFCFWWRISFQFEKTTPHPHSVLDIYQSHFKKNF